VSEGYNLLALGLKSAFIAEDENRTQKSGLARPKKFNRSKQRRRRPRSESLFSPFPPVQIRFPRRGPTGLRQEHQRRREHLRQARRRLPLFRSINHQLSTLNHSATARIQSRLCPKRRRDWLVQR